MGWKELVESVAPVIGGALGGPFGAMAGKFVADALGVDEVDLEDTVSNASPETMLKIKSIETDFKLKMKELGISEEQLHADDRKSARAMAVSTSIYPQVVQSIMYDIAFIGVCYFVFTTKLDFSENQNAMINFIMGLLSAGLVQVNNFWFGSSSGSKDKTQKMQD